MKWEEHQEFGKVLKNARLELNRMNNKMKTKYETRAIKHLNELRNVMDIIVFRDYPKAGFSPCVNTYYGDNSKIK